MIRDGVCWHQHPRVGVGVVVVQEHKILLGRRKGSFGGGFWSLPGGKLEYRETIEECSRREVLEETGLTLGKVISEVGFTNDIHPDTHYITVYTIALGLGDPENREPDKSEPWVWFSPNELPYPLWAPVQQFFAQSPDLIHIPYAAELVDKFHV